MHERVLELLARVFGRPRSELPDDASTETLADWDSLRQLELMLELELEFGVHVPAEAMTELQSVEAIEEFLAERGAG
jgi:acyl carrier protein